MNYDQYHLKKMHSELTLVNNIKTILHIPTLKEELFVH